MHHRMAPSSTLWWTKAPGCSMGKGWRLTKTSGALRIVSRTYGSRFLGFGDENRSGHFAWPPRVISPLLASITRVLLIDVNMLPPLSTSRRPGSHTVIGIISHFLKLHLRITASTCVMSFLLFSQLLLYSTSFVLTQGSLKPLHLEFVRRLGTIVQHFILSLVMFVSLVRTHFQKYKIFLLNFYLIIQTFKKIWIGINSK